MRARFGIKSRLSFYSTELLSTIATRSADILRVPIDQRAAIEIAGRSRGTPRICNALLRRVRDFAQIKGNGAIDLPIAQYGLKALNVDAFGLDEMDNKILTTLIDKFAGGPVGINTLATAVSENAETIEEVYEPFLIQEGYKLDTPIQEIEDDVMNVILYGNEGIERSNKNNDVRFEGIINFIGRHSEGSSAGVQRWAQSFMNNKICPTCEGTRLKKEAHFFKIGDKNIGELAQMDIYDLSNWFAEVDEHFSDQHKTISTEIMKEINARLGFIVEVGLTYLTLHRSAKTLSGGEAQRIRLATQIGSELMNVLYVLDEPSIGLHQRDNSRLIRSLQRLRDTGNSVIVVEHDKEMIDIFMDYVNKYVICAECKKPDTALVKENGFYFVNCLACGAKHSLGRA
jgi:ABC-type dipeptide/oligopeptide/nickel transport system ATPase subunit